MSSPSLARFTFSRKWLPEHTSPYLRPRALSDGSVVMCCADYDGHTILGHVDESHLALILNSDWTRYLWEGFEKNRLRHPYCQRCLGSSSKLLAWGKGLGSILVSRFMKLQGENRVIIR
ncbi:SPASM domain-containing protein, partial [Thermodesulfobacteriota bacterium]